MIATLDRPTRIAPQPGPQTAFLTSPADIVIYGGSAGGGKTYAELLEPLRHIDNSRFTAVVFRRSFPQIAAPGGLWDAATRIYPLLNAKGNETNRSWNFPSGASADFSHMQYEKDKLNWQGSEIALIEFDELCQFTEGQFWYLVSRNRSTCGVRPYIRATCNPDPDSWVADFIAWWIGEDGYAIPERSGVIRWMVRINDEVMWADSREELEQRYPGIPPKSVTFILSTLWDNKILMQADPGYLANLMSLPLVERERLLGDRERGGNWKVRPAAGKVFNRGWFEIVDAVPAGGEECRGWDFAATAKEMRGDDPDYTAGVKVRKAGGVYYVLDCLAVQEGPAEADRLFLNYARQDGGGALAGGARYRVRWEIEPGSAGIRETARLVRMLDGLDAKGIHPTGDKLTRARALAAQAQAGNVKLLRGPWNEPWLRHMHGQPDLPHDDIMDATALAYNDLAAGQRPKATMH